MECIGRQKAEEVAEEGLSALYSILFGDSMVYIHLLHVIVSDIFVHDHVLVGQMFLR